MPSTHKVGNADREKRRRSTYDLMKGDRDQLQGHVRHGDVEGIEDGEEGEGYVLAKG